MLSSNAGHPPIGAAIAENLRPAALPNYTIDLVAHYYSARSC